MHNDEITFHPDPEQELTTYWVDGQPDRNTEHHAYDEVVDEHPARPDKRNRVPHKQLLTRLKTAKHPSVRLYVEEQERKKHLQSEIKNAGKREKRASERAVRNLEQPIEDEYLTRLKSLQLGVKYRRGDKLLEQLVGREVELASFWKAMALAAFRLRRKPTDTEIAKVFADLTSPTTPVSKDKARTRRLLITKLEKTSVWNRLV